MLHLLSTLASSSSGETEIIGKKGMSEGKMAKFGGDFLSTLSPNALFASQGIDITPNQDQGVFKIVKRHGVEGEKPMIGDKVQVHYTGKLLNGKKLESTFDQEPCVFNVALGQVIKAWDIGVCSMQKGEICLLLCKPEYAYGSVGSPPMVPPNSTLLFEVELLNFKGHSLTEDGGILRRIKVKGEGYNNPNEGATVHVHLEGRCGDRIFDSRDVNFVVGESEDVGIPLGVDRAMERMQKGECCLLYLQPKYGYGKEGKPEYNIGPNAELVYEVTLKDFQKTKEFWKMDLKEKLEQAVLVKQKGTQYFMAGCYYQAVILYQRIVTWLEMECGTEKEQRQTIQAILLAAHLNLALCYLRLQEYFQVVENCNKVLELDFENEKALYRRGEAHLLQNDFTLALRDFRQVLQVYPYNQAARHRIAVCQRKMREYHEREKKIYANMFQRFAEHDAKVSRLKRNIEQSGVMDQMGKTVKRRRHSQDGP